MMERMEPKVLLNLIKTPEDQPLFYKLYKQEKCYTKMEELGLGAFEGKNPRPLWQPDLGGTKPAMDEADMVMLYNQVDDLITDINTGRTNN